MDPLHVCVTALSAWMETTVDIRRWFKSNLTPASSRHLDNTTGASCWSELAALSPVKLHSVLFFLILPWTFVFLRPPPCASLSLIISRPPLVFRISRFLSDLLCSEIHSATVWFPHSHIPPPHLFHLGRRSDFSLSLSPPSQLVCGQPVCRLESPRRLFIYFSLDFLFLIFPRFPSVCPFRCLPNRNHSN